MAAPSDVPFDLLSVGADQVESEIDPTLRTPAFRQRQAQEEARLDMDESEIMQLLSTYFDEAENARETGLHPRHEVWEDNLHSFWMRKDFSDKMDWQSQEVSAATPNFVERFAAVHRRSLAASRDWAKIKDLGDTSGTLSAFSTKLTRLALDFCGTNASGQPTDFEFIFGNLCKTGALMMMMAAITWDPKVGRVVVEQVDPRQCYFDPTGRGLYRVRFWEVDKEKLKLMAEQTDNEGNSLWDVDAIEELIAHHDMRVVENKEDASGEGQMLTSHRTPILLKEWLVDIIDRSEGAQNSKIVREKQLIVTANDQRIIRGPEPNPWWHGKDWIVAHPVFSAPLMSPAGRTYVELFRPAADTHENITNRILDIFSMLMNAFEVDPDALEDPEVIENGIAPNQILLRSEDAAPGEQAVRTVEMGRTIPAEAFNLWEASRKEMQEAASQSDLSLGNTVQSGDTTATEAALAAQGQGALNDSIAMDIDMAFLQPLVELVYYTALQKVGPDAPGIWNGLSPNERQMLEARREEFRNRPMVVRATGLTHAADRRNRIRGLLGALNVIGGNPLLAQAFQGEFSIPKLVKQILEDFGVQTEELKLTEREKLGQIDQAFQGRIAAALGQLPPQGAGGGVPGQTAQNQNGPDPLAPASAEGLPGDVRT